MYESCEISNKKNFNILAIRKQSIPSCYSLLPTTFILQLRLSSGFLVEIIMSFYLVFQSTSIVGQGLVGLITQLWNEVENGLFGNYSCPCKWKILSDRNVNIYTDEYMNILHVLRTLGRLDILLSFIKYLSVVFATETKNVVILKLWVLSFCLFLM